jgi:hypothetical protein
MQHDGIALGMRGVDEIELGRVGEHRFGDGPRNGGSVTATNWAWRSRLCPMLLLRQMSVDVGGQFRCGGCMRTVLASQSRGHIAKLSALGSMSARVQTAGHGTPVAS